MEQDPVESNDGQEEDEKKSDNNNDELEKGSKDKCGNDKTDETIDDNTGNKTDTSSKEGTNEGKRGAKRPHNKDGGDDEGASPGKKHKGMEVEPVGGGTKTTTSRENEFSAMLEDLIKRGATDDDFSTMKELLNRKKKGSPKKQRGGDTVKNILERTIREVGHQKANVLHWWNNSKGDIKESGSIDGGKKEDVVQQIANTLIAHWKMEEDKKVD